ncbi:MAG: CoA pyrophosphatase [Deltaproteobacteria bacterium]|nr:CoA pyrophosphatase [Deltaproteobacteria bacterium]
MIKNNFCAANFDSEFISNFEQALALRPHRVIKKNDYVQAAVLIPLFEKDGDLNVLLTKRTDTVETHQGQISFPGGVRDPEDINLLNTALREADEEVGIKTADVRILGQLDQEVTITNFIISPFVGIIPYPYEFKANPREVARLISVPLCVLRDQEKNGPATYNYHGVDYPSYRFTYQGHVVWGATARILKNFLEVIPG